MKFADTHAVCIAQRLALLDSRGETCSLGAECAPEDLERGFVQKAVVDGGTLDHIKWCMASPEVWT